MTDESNAMAEAADAEHYLAEVVRLRELGEQVVCQARERLAELDRHVVEAEQIVGEMRTARLRTLHHLDQSGA